MNALQLEYPMLQLFISLKQIGFELTFYQTNTSSGGPHIQCFYYLSNQMWHGLS